VRRLDPVDLTDNNAAVGHWPPASAAAPSVDLGNARLVPVSGVLDQFEPLARRKRRTSSRDRCPEASLANAAQAACDSRLGIRAFAASNSFCISKDCHDRLVRLIGRNESGSLVIIHRHVVVLFADARVGMRER